MTAVWSQAEVDAEVIVVDDLSTDGTAELAERLLEKGPGRLVRNTRNLGPGMSRHKGILNASYDLISTIDADDYMMPLKLAAEVEALAGDPRAVAFSDVIYRRNGGVDRWTFEKVSGLNGRELLPLIAGRRTPIPRDMTFHRDLYRRMPGFETMLRMYEDWSFKIELAAVASRWVATGEPGIHYEHKKTGASAGAPARHRFFLHAAFLKHADMLAMYFGSKTIGMLRDALLNFGVPDYVKEGISVLERRAIFDGYLIEDLALLRKRVNRTVFREDITYEDRLRRAYVAVLAKSDAGSRSVIGESVSP
jgi:glycosyltransferase involved in cell wall biosynthesis